MRTSLNLSRRPFINHRLFWIAVASIALVSVWLALWVSSETSRVRAEADEVAQLIRAKEGQVREYTDAQEKRRLEEEKTVLTERHFEELNAARQLIAGRSFSWNGLIADIETFVPNKARIASIQVKEAYAGNGGSLALVEIKAVGQTSAQLTEMMGNLEKSEGLFELRNFNQEAATEKGEVPFMLNVTYTPGRGGH